VRRQEAPPPSVLNAGTVVNVLGIPLISGIIVLSGFYYLTNDTLHRHDDAIKSIQVERDQSRKQFLDNQVRTTEILGKLDTRLAVAETKQETANQTLSRIADEITKLTVNR